MDYNSIPVHYCRKCLSLRIVDVPTIENSEYCDECGSTDIGKYPIGTWEKLYIKRYGHTFLNNKY